MKEKRDEIIILRLTKTEKNRIYEKMFSMGIRSLSAYIRKMALDGYCLNLDLPQLRRMAYLLQNCSNNLNQYAKRANECGKVYAADMEDLRQRLDELIDIGKQEGKSVGYKKWATKFNLKEMSKTLLFLQEQKISSADELQDRAAAATERYHAMGDSIKAAEARLTEIAVLKTHIINYAKTRPVYDAYRKSGYSKKFLEAHREEITLHKAAKAAFDEAGMKRLPKVKELDAEFSELLTKKKAAYPDYRKARNEMQELVRAQKNVERFFAEEKDTIEKAQTR